LAATPSTDRSALVIARIRLSAGKSNSDKSAPDARSARQSLAARSAGVTAAMLVSGNSVYGVRAGSLRRRPVPPLLTMNTAVQNAIDAIAADA
jgi:hypothetical protein